MGELWISNFGCCEPASPATDDRTGARTWRAAVRCSVFSQTRAGIVRLSLTQLNSSEAETDAPGILQVCVALDATDGRDTVVNGGGGGGLGAGSTGELARIGEATFDAMVGSREVALNL
jgi:hypothetical protein